MFAMSFIESVIFSRIDLSLSITPPTDLLSRANQCGGRRFPPATGLRPHAGTCRNRIIPALQRPVLIGHRKAGCLGRKVDRDDSRNVGNRELISRNKRSVGEPGVEVSVEIADALLASFDQRPDLIVVMRSGDGPALETRDG